MQNIIKDKLDTLKQYQQKGFFHLLTANVLIQILAFGSQLFVAGILSPEDIGRIKIIQTFFVIISIFAGMGLNASTLKLCSENRSLEEQKSLFISALIITSISTISIYIIVLILNNFHFFSNDKTIQYILPIGVFPIISNALFLVFISYFQAIKKIKLISNLTSLSKLLSLVGIIILTYIWGINGYYVAVNLSLLLILAICFYQFGPFSVKTHFKNLLIHFSVHKQYALTSMFAYLVSEISAYIDLLLISFLVKDMKEVGYYSFALTITVIFRMFPSTVQQITIPYFSSLSNKKNEFVAIFKHYNKKFYQVIILTLITSIAIAPFLLHHIFNEKYDSSMQYFPFLAIGWSIRQLALLQNGAIFGLGKVKYNAYTSIITLMFSIILVPILLHFYGLIGVAYGSIPCGLVLFISSRFFYNRAISKIN